MNLNFLAPTICAAKRREHFICIFFVRVVCRLWPSNTEMDIPGIKVLSHLFTLHITLCQTVLHFSKH
jgi:hypothetical protein